jgi:ABC-type sugar transport system ATPase subunit
MNGLSIRGLRKSLGGNLVVDDVSFDIPEGEFFVLLGPSGGGKTTILRLICGLDQTDGGTIHIDDRDVTTAPSRDRNLAMVFQEYGLYPNMDVYHNIAYGLETRGLPRAEVKQRVTEAAAALDITALIDRSIVDLSGGEQQRVALARAMAKDASLYLFDEPLSNLDPKLRVHARRQIMMVHRRKQKASLYVTHDQTEALAMANRIGIMAEGKLQQVGTPDDLVHDPVNLFVARFIGSPPMNLLPGAVIHGIDGHQVVASGISMTLPDSWRSALNRYGKEEVVVGIRPDALIMRGDTHAASIVGQIADVEPLIGETVVVLNLDGGATVSAVLGDDSVGELTPGATFRAGIDVDRVRLFDPASEQALPVGSRNGVMA